jgi:hypothetical protein
LEDEELRKSITQISQILIKDNYATPAVTLEQQQQRDYLCLVPNKFILP